MADALRAGSANLFGKVPAWAGVLAFLVSRWLLLCFLVGFVLAVCFVPSANHLQRHEQDLGTELK